MSVRRVAASAVGNTFLLMVLFFLSFPIVAPWLLWALRVVLESLNSI